MYKHVLGRGATTDDDGDGDGAAAAAAAAPHAGVSVHAVSALQDVLVPSATVLGQAISLSSTSRPPTHTACGLTRRW